MKLIANCGGVTVSWKIFEKEKKKEHNLFGITFFFLCVKFHQLLSEVVVPLMSDALIV